jgi:hypothetical protein
MKIIIEPARDMARLAGMPVVAIVVTPACAPGHRTGVDRDFAMARRRADRGPHRRLPERRGRR